MSECVLCSRVAAPDTDPPRCGPHRENCPECRGWRGDHGLTCSLMPDDRKADAAATLARIRAVFAARPSPTPAEEKQG